MNDIFLGISYAHWLVVLSSIIGLFGAFAYIRNTIAGKTKPNLVSWSMWAFAPLVGVGAAFSIGADVWVTARIFLAGFIPLLVISTVWARPQSYWKLTTFDFLCGACSLIALGAWLIVDLPRFAVLLAAIGDGFAAMPTIRKAWRFPETETGTTFIASFISVLLTLPSIPTWNVENAAFPIYLIIVNTILVVAIYRKRVFRHIGI